MVVHAHQDATPTNLQQKAQATATHARKVMSSMKTTSASLLRKNKAKRQQLYVTKM
jgi:hypothetical protein